MKEDEDTVAAIAWLSKSFGGHNFMGKFTKGFGYRRKTICKWKLDKSEVFVHFVGRDQKFSNGYFEPDKYFAKFVKAVIVCLKRYEKTRTLTEHPDSAVRALKNITKQTKVLTALAEKDPKLELNALFSRRRMAQRTHSSRRDSPVMVRLLQEIVAAQDNSDKP